jgi:predicted phosphoribosyltransferase
VPFTDRIDAGRRLAGRLRHLRGENVVVLGLPRGGVPVAAEVARALDSPLARRRNAPTAPGTVGMQRQTS